YAFSMTRTETTGLDTISLHDALPISAVQDVPPYGSAAHEADGRHRVTSRRTVAAYWQRPNHMTLGSAQKCPLEASSGASTGNVRSEEHTSELQSRENLVCRLLLEKKN